MRTVFDLQKLDTLLADFYRLSRIRITVFDDSLHELTSYPQALPPVCRLVRQSAAGEAACRACDRAACAAAVAKGSTHIYRCHAGLTEAAVPLYAGKVLAGYLLFGNVFPYSDYEEGAAAIAECCAGLPLDGSKLRQACAASPLIDEPTVRAAAHILHAVASFLVLESMAVPQPEDDAARLNDYISAHFTEDLTGEKLCGLFGMGRTRLYRLARQLYGCGVAQQVRRLRMEQARDLLRTRPELSIADIAGMCGYPDYNYFISVFSAAEGVPPGTWRRQQK